MGERLRPGCGGTARTLHWQWGPRITLAVAVAGGGSCVEIQPDVQYSGGRLLQPTAPSSIVVLRTDRPNRPYADLGTVSVTCPTVAGVSFGVIEQEGGCTYDEAVTRASVKIAEMGADGIYGVTTSAAANGAIVSLVATAFKYQDSLQQPAARPSEAIRPGPDRPAAPPTALSTEARLQQLKELRDKALITAEEYEKRKAEILKHL